VGPPGQLKGGSWDEAYDKQRRILQFANGSRFEFMTFEQDLDKFSGTALHRVHYDEEPPEQIRSENQMRLIDYGGDELFTMTPLYGHDVDVRQDVGSATAPGYTVVQVDMDDNPHLNQEAKERLLEGLTHEERQARKEGRFVHFAGMVFPEFTGRWARHHSARTSERSGISQSSSGSTPASAGPALLRRV
jgi:phage terminase large subunit-like protein